MDAVTKHTLGPGKGETASLELTLWSVGSRLSMTFDLPEGSARLEAAIEGMRAKGLVVESLTQ